MSVIYSFNQEQMGDVEVLPGVIVNVTNQTVTENGVVRPFSTKEYSFFGVSGQEECSNVVSQRLQELQQEQSHYDAISTRRNNLYSARQLLREYGGPSGQSFSVIYPIIQSAVLAYRDSGVHDDESEEHIAWMTTRTSEITAYALNQAGLLP